MSSLDSWNQEFGEIDIFERKKRDRFEYEMEVAYPVRIVSGEIVKSRRGDVQIKANVAILENDREDAKEIARAVEFFTLPKQSSDLNLNNYDLVSKLTQRRTADVVRILSAANRVRYGLYARMESVDGQKVYFDFEDKPLSDKGFKEREAQIHEDITKWVDDAHQNVGDKLDELADTHLYIRKVANKKDARYPYTNLYANRPRDGKVYGDEEAPF